MNIRTELRNIINKDDISNFLDHTLTPEAIEYVNNTMKLLYDNNRDNLFMYLLLLLYNEDISYSNLQEIINLEFIDDTELRNFLDNTGIDITSSEYRQLLKTLNKNLTDEELLEYTENYTSFKDDASDAEIRYMYLHSNKQFSEKMFENICNNIFGVTNAEKNSIKSNFVRELIPNIYYSRSDISAYKDLNNIKSEAVKIYNLLTTAEKDLYKLLAGIDIQDEETEEDAYNFLSFFCRINDREANCESSIQNLSYILNRDVFYYPIQLYYVKDEIKNKTDSEKMEMKTLLENIFQKIASRTIYY